MAYLKTTLEDNLTERARALSDVELIENLDHPARYVRAFVLREAALRNAVLREFVPRELLKPSNRQAALKGFITVTLFVLGEMWQDPAARSDARRIFDRLDRREREDFAAYLGENVLAGEPQTV